MLLAERHGGRGKSMRMTIGGLAFGNACLLQKW